MPEILIEDVIVGDRRREEFGQIEELARSIKRLGLAHPIVIDEDNHLIAGERRLRAYKLLGRDAIPYTMHADLTEKQKQELELDENLRRKDLTPYEMSKTMVAKAAMVAERLRDEAQAVAAEREEVVDASQPDDGGFLLSDSKKPGRPTGTTKPDSEDAVAHDMQVAQQTLNNAQHHVATVAKYLPVAGSMWNQVQVLRFHRAVGALNEHEILALTKIVDDPDVPGAHASLIAERLSKMAPSARAEILASVTDWAGLRAALLGADAPERQAENKRRRKEEEKNHDDENSDRTNRKRRPPSEGFCKACFRRCRWCELELAGT